MSKKIQIGLRTLCIIFIGMIFTSTIIYSDYTPPKKSKIIIGGDYTYPPYEFIDESGKAAGFCVDLSKAIADIMNLDIEIKLDKWANIRRQLEEGEIDALQGMYYSQERDEVFDFSTPHSTVHHSIFIVKGAPPIQSIEGLRGKSIVTLNGDIMHDYIVQNNITDKLTVADNYVDVLKLLQTGNYDCAVMAKISALYWIKNRNIQDIEPVGSPILPMQYCYSVVNDNKELLSIINEGLALLKQNGTYKEIYDKWLGVLDPKGVPKETIIIYALYIGIPTIIAVIIMMLWSWSLKKEVIARTNELQLSIDQLKKTDIELRESNQKYHSLFLNMQDGFSYHKIILDNCNNPIDFTYIEVNDAYEVVTGMKREKILGKCASEIYSTNILQECDMVNIFGEVAITGKNLKMDQYFEPLDKWFSISAYSPKYGYFVTIVNDITERKRFVKEIIDINEVLERRVEQRTRELIAINKELEAFSYSVSHDLRAPLRSIDGFSQALLEDYEEKLDQQGKNYLSRVRSASQRMAQLIDDLLELSRITRGELQKELVDMSIIAQGVMDELRSIQPRRNAQVSINKDVFATGDIRLIRVALENLLGNAWKYTSKNNLTEIEFGMFYRDEKKIYYVKDNGVGFDMKYSNKLFGAFQRLHGATEFEGSGIGLATVQRIINKHGGNIWAESEVGKGTQFFFTLDN